MFLTLVLSKKDLLFRAHSEHSLDQSIWIFTKILLCYQKAGTLKDCIGSEHFKRLRLHSCFIEVCLFKSWCFHFHDFFLCVFFRACISVELELFKPFLNVVNVLQIKFTEIAAPPLKLSAEVGLHSLLDFPLWPSASCSSEFGEVCYFH